jgi:hypothetical protein
LEEDNLLFQAMFLAEHLHIDLGTVLGWPDETLQLWIAYFEKTGKIEVK